MHAFASPAPGWSGPSQQHVLPGPSAGTLDGLLAGRSVVRRTLRKREYVFHAGQPRRSLFLVHAGVFKTSLLSADGRERITGFRFRGDVLGLDAFDLDRHRCDAVALDVGEVWELPCDAAVEIGPDLARCIASMLAGEVRRDWNWMLTLGTLDAEQRVVAFLLDLADRMEALGYSAQRFSLRMTRAEIASFLALKLETVTRALTRLHGRGLIAVDGRHVDILDARGMRDRLAVRRCH